MADLVEIINAVKTKKTETPEEENERYRRILMKLLDETKREFDRWPKWKKQYSVSSTTTY